MGWLIDTSLWIDLERGAISAADIHAVTRQAPVYLSPINVAEMQFGIELLAPAQRARGLSMLRRLRRKPQLRITTDTARTFGTLAAALRKAGKDPGVRVNDLWLAAQAVERGFALLTTNARDFRDIPGLNLTVLGRRAR
jgi:predicted nucleic acid-binding protein